MGSSLDKAISKTIEKSLDIYDYELTIPLTNFIFQSPLHWNVMTIIALATYKEEFETSFQHLCTSISSKTGSKSSIQSIIEIGIERGFIEKKTLKRDKRIKSLTLTNKAKKDYSSWIAADAKTYYPIIKPGRFNK